MIWLEMFPVTISIKSVLNTIFTSVFILHILVINYDHFLSLSLQNLSFNCLSSKLNTLLDQISIKH